VTRICNLPCSDGGAGIILAGHSQGSTIAAATVRQLPPERRERVFLLTFGTQLNRLYGRVFPAFFGPAQLARLARDLGPPGTVPRWRNFFRRTDPMGFPVEVQTQTWSVDAPPLDDPARLVPTDGEVVYPKICGHSDYPSDATYLATRDVAASRLL
jgi:pimeloyl-ACP methyl ester carboxylesterase